MYREDMNMKLSMKNILNRFVLVVAGTVSLAVVGSFSISSALAQPALRKQMHRPYVSNEVLVKFRTGVSASARDHSLRDKGARHMRNLSHSGWMHVKLPI